MVRLYLSTVLTCGVYLKKILGTYIILFEKGLGKFTNELAAIVQENRLRDSMH